MPLVQILFDDAKSYHFHPYLCVRSWPKIAPDKKFVSVRFGAI